MLSDLSLTLLHRLLQHFVVILNEVAAWRKTVTGKPWNLALQSSWVDWRTLSIANLRDWHRSCRVPTIVHWAAGFRLLLRLHSSVPAPAIRIVLPAQAILAATRWRLSARRAPRRLLS